MPLENPTNFVVDVDGRNMIVVVAKTDEDTFLYIIFYRLNDDGVWERVNYFFEDDLGYGYEVSLSGDTAMAGFGFANVEGKPSRGTVLIFQRNSVGVWDKVGPLKPNDELGSFTHNPWLETTIEIW